MKDSRATPLKRHKNCCTWRVIRSPTNLKSTPRSRHDDPADQGNCTLHLLDSARGNRIQSWEFRDQTAIRIGRSAENDINLADSQVSRKHVELIYRGGGWVLISHGRNGTWLDGAMVYDIELASGVMIGGPYRPIDQIIETQLDFTVQLIEQQGMTEEQALALPPVASLAEMVDGVKAIRAGGTEPVAGTSAEFWNSWFDLHESTLSSAAEMTQPLLVLNGEMDWNVPATEAESWRQYLDSIDANAEVQTLPCVTHALNCVQGTNPLAITPADIGRNIAPEVVDAIVRFLGE